MIKNLQYSWGMIKAWERLWIWQIKYRWGVVKVRQLKQLAEFRQRLCPKATATLTGLWGCIQAHKCILLKANTSMMTTENVCNVYHLSVSMLTFALNTKYNWKVKEPPILNVCNSSWGEHECYYKISQCWDILFHITNVNLMVALGWKLSSSGNHECPDKISLQVFQ